MNGTRNNKSPNKNPNISGTAANGKASKSNINDIKSQTPVNRKLRMKNVSDQPGTSKRVTAPQHFRIKEDGDKKQVKSKPVTPKVAEKNDSAKKKSKKRSVIRSRIMLVVILYLILMPSALLLFYSWLPKHKTPETQNYIYQVGENGSVISRNVYPWNVVRRGNVYYLDMNGIADFCDLITTGDSERIRYIERTSRESVEFCLDSSVVSVNGYIGHMDDDSYYSNGKVYVPLEFVNRCFVGVTAELDKDNNKITVKRDRDEKGNYVSLSFSYRPTATNDSILFSDIDPDIQNEILARERALREQEERIRQEAEQQQLLP